MNIQNLSLTNFRNFSSKKVVFDPKLTVILGPNGVGKSNILEAVGLLAATRIHKVDTDLDFVRFGQADAKVEGQIDGDETPFRPDYADASTGRQGSAGQGKTLTINLQIDDPQYSSSERSESKSNRGSSPQGRTIYKPYVRKTYYIDGIKKRLVDFTEHFAIVVFEPSDLELVSGSPSDRRHHLDTLLASINRDYWRAISNYNKIVVRRNKVLQRILDGKSKKSELDFWDERLLEHGKYLTEARQQFFEFINFVNGKRGGYSWQIKQSLVTDEKLARNRDRDIAAGVTLSGPHRDDFVFLFRDKNLEFFGSRGEQRMAVLALKLAELEYCNSKRGARPILALDDIFSELDWEHREAVLGVIDKQQTIITAAEAESLPKQIFKKSKVVELR
ncbi:MAG: DNA replication and repair protein RecF [Candidatus Curtissbacteria bacterium]|nr:DNA replication and repair protein RecF [Candidatus Curtissbacteria bacterium]